MLSFFGGEVQSLITFDSEIFFVMFCGFHFQGGWPINSHDPSQGLDQNFSREAGNSQPCLKHQGNWMAGSVLASINKAISKFQARAQRD